MDGVVLIPAERFGVLRNKSGRHNPYFMWEEALEILMDGYLPANDIAESTHQFSTEEIISKLVSHTGEPVDPSEVTDTMQRWGFKYVRTGDLCLEWLLLKRSH